MTEPNHNAAPNMQYTLEQLHEVAYVTIKDKSGGDDDTIVSFFRLLAKQYAPDFASLFKDPGIENIDLEGVSSRIFVIFAEWLVDCWYWDVGTTRDLWAGQHPDDQKPNFFLLGTHSRCVFEDEPGYPYYEGRNGNVLSAVGYSPFEIAEDAVDVYLFADTYNIPQLKKDAIDRLSWFFSPGRAKEEDKKYPCRLPPKLINRAFQKTGPGCPLREILIDGFCLSVHAKDEKFLQESNKDFVVGVALCYSDASFSNSPTNFFDQPTQDTGLNRCDYHDHPRGIQCPSRVISKWN